VRRWQRNARLVIGGFAVVFAVCMWIVVHFFMFPKRADVYRAWVRIGLVVTPLALAMAIAVWR